MTTHINPDRLLSAFAFLNRKPVKTNADLKVGTFVTRTDSKSGIGTVENILRGIALVRFTNGTYDCIHVDSLKEIDKPETKDELLISKAQALFERK
jgi:hypothetical protein